METKIKGYKGFDSELKCRGFQYEVGKNYEMDGEIKVCKQGFHFCEGPMDVLYYYAPVDDNGKPNRFCEVEGGGDIDKESYDGKIACSKLHIGVEIGLEGLIEAGVKFILDKVDWKNKKESNTGDRSAATNRGDRSAATNRGDRSAATNTGDRSAATNTGDNSAASVRGKESVAIVTGKDSMASGALGCWIVLTERGEWNGETYPILNCKAFKVDGENIKADTFYKLVDGEPMEVK